ncbi:hypothetical protein niasHT_024679 [Heterodera trifolii]|uniref:Uncharacterized protein n=1 Tax=Heterodera trifolii TaxID=157864 RepID=A0ABD2K7P3_9BILA
MSEKEKVRGRKDSGEVYRDSLSTMGKTRARAERVNEKRGTDSQRVRKESLGDWHEKIRNAKRRGRRGERKADEHFLCVWPPPPRSAGSKLGRPAGSTHIKKRPAARQQQQQQRYQPQPKPTVGLWGERRRRLATKGKRGGGRAVPNEREGPPEDGTNERQRCGKGGRRLLKELMMLKCHSRRSIPGGHSPSICARILWRLYVLSTNLSVRGWPEERTAAICDRESFSGGRLSSRRRVQPAEREPAKTQSRLRLAGKDEQSHKNVCLIPMLCAVHCSPGEGKGRHIRCAIVGQRHEQSPSRPRAPRGTKEFVGLWPFGTAPTDKKKKVAQRKKKKKH